MNAKPNSLDWGLLDRYAPVLEQAFTIRLVEERLLQLFSEGKLFGTIHTCIGQEFCGPAISQHLQGNDYVVSNHRGHGHFLSYGEDVEGLISEIMGKSTGVCGGRGGSQHLCQNRFLSNGILGGTVPVAAGLALAQKMDDEEGIVVVFVGDGTLGEGVLYETMNLAAKWELPLLVVLENNRCAQSTPQEQTLAGDILERFRSFGIDTAKSNTWDWEDLFSLAGESVAAVRSGGGPRFHMIDTYRLKAHSKGDDHRSAEELNPFIERDPVNQLLAHHEDDERLQAILARVTARIDRAVEEAEAAPFSEVLGRDTDSHPEVEWGNRAFERERVVASVGRALEEALADPRTILIGEDIEAPYGGAFKVTGDLSSKYPSRVKNTPISEAAIVGMGNGLALGGYRPVVEVMFGDFLPLAADQWINHAAKFSWMYNEQFKVPVIIRTPMGGKRGYGPTHSQSLEKHFLGLPRTRVVCLHHRYSPHLVYKELLADGGDPTLVIENKTLYAHYVEPDPPAGFELVHSNEKFPTTWLRPVVPADVTLVVIGGMSLEAEEAVISVFENDEITADLFLPTSLYPLNVGFLGESILRTRRLLVVEEGQGFASLSSEIVAQVSESFGHAGLVCRRLTAGTTPIPTSRPLEDACLPNTQSIIHSIVDVVGE